MKKLLIFALISSLISFNVYTPIQASEVVESTETVVEEDTVEDFDPTPFPIVQDSEGKYYVDLSPEQEAATKNAISVIIDAVFEIIMIIVNAAINILKAIAEAF